MEQRRFHWSRRGRPIDGASDVVVSLTGSALDDQALRGDAPKIDAACLGLELKEIGAAKQIFARLVLQLKRFTVSAEHARGIVWVIESQSKDECSAFGF